MSTSKVAVIGGSSWGGWIALKLLEAGMSVTVVEPKGAGHDESGSGGFSRIIRATYGGDPLYMDMVSQAFEEWKAYAAQWNKQLITPTGLLWLFQGDPHYARQSLQQMQQYDHVLEEWNPQIAEKRFPDFCYDDIRQVYFEPEAGYIEAGPTCDFVRQQVVAAGGEWLCLSGKPGALQSGKLHELILSNGSRLNADFFVFAAGAWNPLLFPEILQDKVYLSRHDVSFFAAGSTHKLTNLPIWLDFDPEGILFYGIPHQSPGIKVSFDERTYRLPDAAAPRAADEKLAKRNQDYLAWRLPFTRGAQLTKNRVCIYDNTPDGDFIIDLHPECSNVLIASGTSGHGYKMGPAIGNLVANWLNDKELLPERFSLKRFEQNAPPQSQFFAAGKNGK